MGITGLLPFLEKATRPCSISEYRGATVVVDAYCWLHKGATGCAVQLAQGQDTEIYVNYCLKYVKMLQSYNIRPILVFDGKNLPAKSLTEARRRQTRNNAKKRAAELLRLGKTDEARTFMKQSINVTPEMASAVIKACRKLNVNCIVAPYESDAQLAFFNLRGIAEVVITEDSDLVLFGCTKVMYKLDLQGYGYLVEVEKIPQAMQLRPDKYTFDKFRHMCILSGCDYIDSLPGIGLKKALKFIRLTEETNPVFFLKNVPRYLNMRSLQVTQEYIENFMIANATFLHQVVFDPYKKKLVHLQDPFVCGTTYDYCKNAGEMYDNERAYQVALGNLHPTSDKKLDDWCPNETDTSSIWSGTYKKTISRKTEQAQLKSLIGWGDQIKKEEVTDTTTEDEQDKVEEEKLLNKELEFYFKKPIKVEPDEMTKNRPFIRVDKGSPYFEDTIEVETESKNELDEIMGVKQENLEQDEEISDEPVSYSGEIIKSDSEVIIKSEPEDSDNPDDEDGSDSIDLDKIIVRLAKERSKIERTNVVVSSRFFSKSVLDSQDESEIEGANSERIIHTKTSRTQSTNTQETEYIETSQEIRKIEESSSLKKSSGDTGEHSKAKRRKIVESNTVGMTCMKPSQQKISDFFAGFRKK